MAQIDNLNEFTRGLRNIADNESLIIIEFPYLMHMIDKGLFDLIYHEHLSYFSLTPLKFLFGKFDIKIVNFERLNIGASGPAIRLFLAKNNSIYKSSKKVIKQINYEKNWGVKKIKKYNFFKKKTKEKVKKIKEIVYSKYNNGYRIGCYTASSKGNTLLNCLNFKKNVVLFASENNKKKIGKYTPGSHIKIISDESFNKKGIDYAILLSWNYKNFFLSKTQFIKRGGKFIIPLPTPYIE